MASVASANPPTPHIDPNIATAKSNGSDTAKRKRVHQAEGTSQGNLQQLEPSKVDKAGTTEGKQTQAGKAERTQSRGRQQSLRHVKNSTEVLRHRSSKRGNQGTEQDKTPGGREGRSFTVANVGNNGKIYLRSVKAE